MKRSGIIILIFIFLIPCLSYKILPELAAFTNLRNQFLSTITFKIKTAHPENIKFYRKSSKDKYKLIDNFSDLSSLSFVRNLIVVISKDEIPYLSEISLSIGNRQFTYARDNFLKEWNEVSQLENFPKSTGNFRFFLAPEELKSDSIFTKLFFWNHSLSTIINWTPKLLLPFVVLCLVISCYLFTLICIIFVFKDFKFTYSTKNKKDEARPWDTFLAPLFVLCTAVYFARVGLDVLHQGFLFHAALKLTEGKVLFKEIYFHYGALTALLHEWSLLIFGKKLIVLNLLTAFFYFAIATAFWKISTSFFSKKHSTLLTIVWSLLAPYLVMTMIPWSSVLSLFFMMLSLILIFKYLETERLLFLFYTGIITGLCFWTRQSVGPLLVIAIYGTVLLFYLVEKINLKIIFKNICILSLGIIFISLPFFLWLLANNALSDWFLQNFIGQSEWAASKGALLHNLFNALFSLDFWGMLPIATLIVLFFSVRKFFQEKYLTVQDKKLIVLCIVSLASWAQYFPITCPRHHFWGGTPMFIPFFILFTSVMFSALNKKNISGFFICLIIATTSFSEIRWHLAEAYNKIRIFKFKVEAPSVIRDMLVDSQDTVIKLSQIDQAISEYRKNHKNVSILSDEPGNLLFLSFVPNSELPTALPTALFSFGSLKKRYNYEKSSELFIKEKAPLIFTSKRYKDINYYEILHVKFEVPLDNQDGEVYLYAPLKR